MKIVNAACYDSLKHSEVMKNLIEKLRKALFPNSDLVFHDCVGLEQEDATSCGPLCLHWLNQMVTAINSGGFSEPDSVKNYMKLHVNEIPVGAANIEWRSLLGRLQVVWSHVSQ